MTTRRINRRRYGVLALVLAPIALLGWAVADLRTTSVLTLQACMEVESGARAWVCRQALYRLHPTKADMKALNEAAGAQFPARIADQHEATRLLQHYLRAGLDVNAVDQRTQLKWTALHSEAFEGNVQAVRLLLDNGADSNAKDGTGRTPLDIAREANAKTPSDAYAQIVSMLAARKGKGPN